MMGSSKTLATLRACPRLIAAAIAIATCQAMAADDVADTGSEPSQQAPEVSTEVPVVTSDSATASGGRADGGPSIEFVTGGSSTDGAAKVRRLPVID